MPDLKIKRPMGRPPVADRQRIVLTVRGGRQFATWLRKFNGHGNLSDLVYEALRRHAYEHRFEPPPPRHR